MGDSDSCSICFETFRCPKILPCGHTFCFPCLKNYSDEMNSRRRKLHCPLCRANCKIRQTDQLLTNYFVPISKQRENCSRCKISEISGCCHVCNSYFCMKCSQIHAHQLRNSSLSDDESDQQDPDMPYQFMHLKGIKTKYICKLETHFVVDTPPNAVGRHHIYSLCASKSGDVFVLPCSVRYILKFDKKGQILERIRTPKQCASILECKDDSILGTFPYDKLILKYAYDGWANFTSCQDFFPIDLVEVSSGDIALCGSDQLQASSDNCLKRTGFIQIYSPQGLSLKRLDKIFGNVKLLSFPIRMAYFKKKKTIAIVDQDNSSVVVLQEDGEFHRTYKGGSQMFTVRIPVFGFENRVHFHPFGISCSLNGCFIISTADGCLHVLNNSGELCGVALTDCEDGFGLLLDVTMDKNGIIWCSNSQNGTVKTFKIVKFTNDLNESNSSS